MSDTSREAQHARPEIVLELSAASQALAHSTQDHKDRSRQAVADLSRKIP